MVPVPEQVPLADAGQYMMEGKEGIVETMIYLAPQFPLSTHVRYCRNPARGIVSAVRERRTEMLIMGWHGRRRSRLFFLGSTVDPVVERSPCNVVILKDCGGDRVFKRILVPLAGGPNGALALEIAGILADEEEGAVTAFTVAGRKGFDLDSFVSANLDRIALPPNRVTTKVAAERNATRAILAEAAEGYDLVVIGATGRPRLAHVASESVPDTVAHRCPTPLVMVKASAGIRSWIKRWV
jgi:nucleotide-binding universal stress UspA family protein